MFDSIDCVQAIVVEPVDPDIVHVALDSVFYRSNDAGVSWTSVAPPPEIRGQTITALALDSAHPAALYATAAFSCINQYGCGGSVLRSLDGGENWSVVGRYDTTANSIVVGADSSVYVGGGSAYEDYTVQLPPPPGFLIRSVDGGTTWADSSPMDAAFVSQVAIGPDGRLHAATSAGLFASSDRGDSWISEPAQLPIDQVAVDPIDPMNVYVTGNHRNNGGLSMTVLQRSTAGGASWSTLTSPAAVNDIVGYASLFVVPTHPATLYVAYLQQLYLSTDRGSTWMPSGLGLGSVVVGQLAIDPTDGSVNATAGSLFRSSDRASTWMQRGARLEFVYAVAFDPTRAGTIYVSNFNGVSKTVDGGATWRPVNHGLRYEQGAGGPSGVLAVDADDPARLYLGGGGLYTSADGGESWVASQNGLASDADI